MFVRQLAPWKAKTEAALMSYVNVAFQSPLTNPYFKLKYEFNRDEDGVRGSAARRTLQLRDAIGFISFNLFFFVFVLFCKQLQPTVEMDFDAEPLAATLVHTIILRCTCMRMNRHI